MIQTYYHNTVALLIRILPLLARESRVALHGGTAINLFLQPLPRLSVDIDLTWFPATDRNNDLKKIKLFLNWLKKHIEEKIPGIHVSNYRGPSNEYKLFCSQGEAMVKIEINTANRGIYFPSEIRPLCDAAQKQFNAFCEVQTVSIGQLYGGKIVAALDRQHPRDFFDVMVMLKTYGYTLEIHQGMILFMLSSQRPLHELLNPTRLNQKSVLENKFSGMTKETFTYEMFENTREKIIETIKNYFTESDKELLLRVCNRITYTLSLYNTLIDS